MAIVNSVDEITKEKFTYYLEDRLKKNFDDKIIPSLQVKDKDCVIAVDGREGSGKSWFAFQIAKYVDPSFDLSRVVFSADKFREALFKAKKGQAVVFDEAFTGFSSRSSLSGVNRTLVSLLMQVRQKNLFIIIVLPTFFLLDKYVAVFRSRALIHVYENKTRRGYYRVYNSRLKKLLYLTGAKTYSYNHKSIRVSNRGRFYNKFALGGAEVEKKYRDKKEKELMETEKNPMSAAQVRYREQRDLMVYLFRKTTKMTFKEMSNLLFDYELSLSLEQLSKICSKFGDIIDKDLEGGKNEKKDTDSSKKETEDIRKR